MSANFIILGAIACIAAVLLLADWASRRHYARRRARPLPKKHEFCAFLPKYHTSFDVAPEFFAGDDALARFSAVMLQARLKLISTTNHEAVYSRKAQSFQFGTRGLAATVRVALPLESPMRLVIQFRTPTFIDISGTLYAISMELLELIGDSLPLPNHGVVDRHRGAAIEPSAPIPVVTDEANPYRSPEAR